MTARSIKATADVTSTDGCVDVVPVDVRDNPPWGRNGVTTTVDANTVMETAVNTTHCVYELVTGTRPTGVLVIADLEPIGRDWILLRIDDTGASCYNSFNITTGVAGTKTAACTFQINSVTGAPGRYRCEIKTQRTFGTSGCYIYTQETDLGSTSFLGDITKGFKVFDLQLSWSVGEYTLPSGFFGKLTFCITGEKAGDPTKTYTYCCDALYSCDAGVATLRSQGTPSEIDPDAYGWEIVLDASGANARARVVGIDGENWIWSCKVTGLEAANQVGELIALGLSAYYDAYYSASVVGADFVYTGAELLVDGNMEAVGVGAWTTLFFVGGVTLTKEGAPHSGAQCLRVTKTGVNGGGWAKQDVVAADWRCRSVGYARSDGVNTPQMAAPSISWWQGTAAGGWQACDVNRLVGAGTRAVYGDDNMTVGQYVEFDDWSLVRTPIVTGHTSQISGGAALSQPGAASTRPTYLNLAAATAQGFTCPCWQTDGTAQFFDTGYTPVDNFAVGGWFYVESIAAASIAFFGSRDAAATGYCYVRRNAASLRSYCGLSGTELIHGTALTVGWHHIVIGRRGTAQWLWLDGVPVSNELAITPPALSIYLQARNYNGTAEVFRAGLVANFGIWNHLPTTAEVLSEMAFSRPLGV